jgi:hypothetical protein
MPGGLTSSTAGKSAKKSPFAIAIDHSKYKTHSSISGWNYCPPSLWCKSYYAIRRVFVAYP